MRLAIRTAIVLVALVAAQQAAAVGPWLWTVNGGGGISTTSGSVHYVPRLSGGVTKIAAVRWSDGRQLRSLTVPGRWGLQAVTVNGSLTGLSGNGRLLVLAPPTRAEPVDVSTFALIRAPELRSLGTISLHGDFSLDAISPNAGTIYLIEHVVNADASRYRVRAYDMRSHTLLRRPIADKRQAGWTMHGFPVARAATPGGSRVYTLYQNDDNYPFIHALDTVGRTAVCIGLPLQWTKPTLLEGVTLRLSADGSSLTVDGPNIRTPLHLDTTSFKITRG